MNVSTRCLSAVELRDVLEGTGDAADRSVVAHLDQCPACQQALEALADNDSSLTRTLRQQAALVRPDPNSAYWAALQKSEQAVTTAPSGTVRSVEVALAFLDPPKDGSHLGSLVNFNILRVVGRGGMGVVLHAIDTCLQRDVAIKVLDPELSKDDVAVSRFCREARAAASISHENVVAIHQVEHDEAKDIPFLVMELVSGESLEKKLEREGPLPLNEVVRIGMQTAAGLAAAHDKGLIHRDIKPANILLERTGLRVKLSDFGLARTTEDVRLTRTGLVAGTPLYMSPEQATGEELDARSDLFSLGVVLYELAAGEAPFAAKTPLAVLKRLTEEQPRPLRELNADLPEWFVHIVDKLLAKDPGERFQSAREVADTLEHFWALLKSSETLVCPKKKSSSPWQAVMVGVSAGLLTLALGTAAVLLLAPRRGSEEKIPEPLHVLKGNAGPLWSLAVSADGKHLAAGADDGTVKYWDIAHERVAWTLPAHKTPIWALALARGGDYLATGSDDGDTKIWDVRTQNEVHTLPRIGGVRALAFDADGKRILTGGRDGSVKVWDVRSQAELVTTSGHDSLVAAVAFAPDGKSFASASADKSIKIWDTGTGKMKLKLTNHERGVYGIAFAPTSRQLVSGGWDRTVRLWDLDSGTQIATFDNHRQDVWSVAFNPEGTLFASAGEDQMVRIWDLETRKEVRSFRGSTASILNVRFTSEPECIVAGGKDGVARIWRFADLASSP
jgi:serine/threonine protein kinase